MKRLSIIFVVLVAVAVAAAGCSKKAEQAEVAKIDTTPTQVIRIDVEGMTCGGCEATIKRAVKKIDGVKQVEADYKAGTATVTINPEKVDAAKVVAAIDGAGYKAKKKEL